MSDQPGPPVIVSGIQPTGNLHLGNYLGAIRNWVRMQDEAASTGGTCFFFLADLHAISLYQDPAALRQAIREMAAALIAAGVDPARATLFRQRDVGAHSELAWLLQGVARADLELLFVEALQRERRGLGHRRPPERRGGPSDEGVGRAAVQHLIPFQAPEPS